MSFSKESRFRNFASATDEPPRGGRPLPIALIVGLVGVILLVCACCFGLTLGTFFGPGVQPVTDNLGSRLSGLNAPTVTPTPDKNAPVAYKKPGLMDNGLELTVLNMTRPLKVQGIVALPTNEQIIGITLQIRNTKKSGTAAIRVTAADFTVKGDGGLVYLPNPKTLSMPSLLNEVSLAPGKDAPESDLIFQIASDDSGLKLYWKSGTQTRVFLLE